MEDVMDPATVEALYLVKWILGGLLAACALFISGAAWLDWRERRRWRAMVPDAWPPAGQLQEEQRRIGAQS